MGASRPPLPGLRPRTAKPLGAQTPVPRPRGRGPAPRPHRLSPRPTQAPGVFPAGGSPTPRDPRKTTARGSGRYLAPRDDGREGTTGPSTTAPASGCRDGSTKSLADVEGGGETRKDAATDPVRRPREAKPSPFCGCALEGCAVFPLPFSGVVSVSERASIIVFFFFSVSSLWSLNSSQELKLVQKRNRSPADSLLVLTYNKLGN